MPLAKINDAMFLGHMAVDAIFHDNWGHVVMIVEGQDFSTCRSTPEAFEKIAAKIAKEFGIRLIRIRPNLFVNPRWVCAVYCVDNRVNVQLAGNRGGFQTDWIESEAELTAETARIAAEVEAAMNDYFPAKVQRLTTE